MAVVLWVVGAGALAYVIERSIKAALLWRLRRMTARAHREQP